MESKSRKRSMQKKGSEAESAREGKHAQKKEAKTPRRRPQSRSGELKDSRTVVKTKETIGGDESLKVPISGGNKEEKDTGGKSTQSSTHGNSGPSLTFVERLKASKMTRPPLRSHAETEIVYKKTRTTVDHSFDMNDGPSDSIWNTLKKHAIQRTFVLLITIICLMAVVIYAWMFGVPSQDRTVVYEDGLIKLRDDFKNQTGRFWKTLKSRGLVHLRTRSPQKPLVVLFAAPPSAYHAMDCFSKKLAANLDPDYPDQLNVIEGKHYTNADTAKRDLDQKLKVSLQSGHQAALIRDLNLLPLPVALLFYSYCDNDNAPYKRVAILFTVQLPREVDPSSSPVAMEGIVEKFLSDDLWGNHTTHDADAVAALVSRISDTVVIVNAEDKNKLNKVCDPSKQNTFNA